MSYFLMTRLLFSRGVAPLSSLPTAHLGAGVCASSSVLTYLLRVWSRPPQEV